MKAIMAAAAASSFGVERGLTRVFFSGFSFMVFFHGFLFPRVTILQQSKASPRGRISKTGAAGALLAINGHDPSRGVAGNFTADEAVRLGKEIDAGILIPCHYAMFEFNTVTIDEFVNVAEKAGQRYRLLRCGERLDLS